MVLVNVMVFVSCQPGAWESVCWENWERGFGGVSRGWMVWPVVERAEKVRNKVLVKILCAV